jgi:protein phosphatase
MDCCGLTDPGKVRVGNEDQFLVADLVKSMLIHQTTLSHEDHTRLFGSSQGQLLLVADGMGGHAEGKRASGIAVQAVAHYVLNTMPWFYRLHDAGESDLHDELKAALEECQRGVEAASAASPAGRPMGTTLTMAYLLWPRLFVVHAGDSRCYLMRGGRLHQITRDHTVAQQLVDRGVLPAGRAEESHWSHVLWNCIGGGSHQLNPDVYRATLEIGDTLLLCTDGLSKPVPQEQIRATLQQAGSAEQACRRLIALANSQGGPDNVTVVVAQFRDAADIGRAHHHAARAEPREAPAPAAVTATAEVVPTT